MATTLEMLLWLLRKAGSAAGKKIIYIATNPGDAALDLWEWIKANKLTCVLIAGGILVIAVPPLLGFSPLGPVAGSIAAGWQAAIGNVAAGSVFAIMQSLTMTGVFTAIGGSIIGGGVLRYLSTCDWVSVAARSIAGFITKHVSVFKTSLSTVQELKKILHRVDELANIMPADEQPRIRELMAELEQALGRIAAITHLYDQVQKLNSAINGDPPEAEIEKFVEELQAAADAFCEPDAGTATLEEEWEECRDRAFLACSRLRRTLNMAIRKGTCPNEASVRRMVKELVEKADELLEMSLPGSED